jgi:hypothetical protein
LAVGLGLAAAASLAAAPVHNAWNIGDSVRSVQALIHRSDGVHALTNFAHQVMVTNISGLPVVALGEDDFFDGLIGVYNHNALTRAVIAVTGDDAGIVVVTDPAGNASFAMDGVGGFVSVNGDLAEAFPTDRTAVPAGSVMAIDPLKPGALRVSDMAYDRRVAGVASGAKDYRPGMTLRALAKIENKVPVTLSGTVYCLATNANGAIKAGDLLTTSNVPGHAMKVTDFDAAHGAIIGKAMQDLQGERGLVLILANLQ